MSKGLVVALDGMAIYGTFEDTAKVLGYTQISMQILQPIQPP